VTVPVANSLPPIPAHAHARLNARELDYLARLAMNEPRKMIAARDGVHRTSVDHVVQSAMDKLGADGLVDAFRRLGWLQAGDTPAHHPTGG
jgi:DNA-binding CsgD family transcriptional regulator